MYNLVENNSINICTKQRRIDTQVPKGRRLLCHCCSQHLQAHWIHSTPNPICTSSSNGCRQTQHLFLSVSSVCTRGLFTAGMFILQSQRVHLGRDGVGCWEGGTFADVLLAAPFSTFFSPCFYFSFSFLSLSSAFFSSSGCITFSFFLSSISS